MTQMLGLMAVILVCLMAGESQARRESFTEEQKQKLEKIQRVLIDVIAITDQGPREPGPLIDTVARRFQEVGYTVVMDSAQPHDVVVRVKCEQQKTWEGTARSGGDADLPDSPSRVWKGPACQFLYLLDGKKMGWRKEVRTEFQDARQAATSAQAADAGVFALAKLNERLEQYGFPHLLAAEWGQEARLLKVLDDPGTAPQQKIKIINLFGDMFAVEAVPRLLGALKSNDIAIAKASAVALGNIGQKESIAALIEMLKTGNPELQAAAAKGLGQVGALHGDFSIIPPLLEALKMNNKAVQTEAAWALGKLPDKRAYEPLYALYRTVQNSADPSRLSSGAGEQDSQETKLKEALNWSLKQVDTFDQLN